MCNQARWKREVVKDHKFDFVNTRDFHSDSWLTKFRYLWVYIFLLKSLAVYGLDIFTAVTMLTTDHWTNAVHDKCGDDCAIKIPFGVAKWIFVGCIIFSFVLLAYEAYKCHRVIISRDISYAYTNVMANDYYSLRSYDHFCFFCQIGNSTKKKDDFAFFIFFTFKGWKRLLLADGPRQSINALTLYSFAYANNFQTDNLPAYWDGSIITLLLLLSMIATVLLFAGSMVLMIIAALLYIPLLCYIQGNLKEYCCHKIDKRVAEMIRRKQKARVARHLALEAKIMGGQEVRNKKGEVIAGVPQPTLPDVAFDEDDEDMQMRTRCDALRADGKPRSVKRMRSDASAGTSSSVAYEEFGLGLPPGTVMPVVPYGGHVAIYHQAGHDRTGPYGTPNGWDPYGSTTNLTAAAAPPAGFPPYPMQPGLSTHRGPMSNPFSPQQPAADYHQPRSNPYPSGGVYGGHVQLSSRADQTPTRGQYLDSRLTPPAVRERDAYSGCYEDGGGGPIARSYSPAQPDSSYDPSANSQRSVYHGGAHHWDGGRRR